ncbi:glycosyltransferase family 2 protein [bacterium]|nr:glycosyltransferase family 2 protein [bacterium]
MNKPNHDKRVIRVIIPAYNEEKSIEHVIRDIPDFVHEIIVVNNNSTDATAKNALEAGATVLSESNPGYGNACLKGIDYIKQQKTGTDIVVFLDGDYSDYPEELTKIVAPIIEKNIDFVLGSRVEKFREKGAMQPQQIFGNWLATFLMRLFFKSKFTDLGPFRAIKFDALMGLKMRDPTYGWTVEMQLKILKQRLSYEEIAVKYRNRIGVSKVSGTLKGSIFAGIKILTWIFKYSFK